MPSCKAISLSRFLSTLSLRRATTEIWPVIAVITISIHALLAESDHDGRVNLLGFQNFYPRSPCGERRPSSKTVRRSRYFYPRSPCGERRTGTTSAKMPQSISIHALLAESDVAVNVGTNSASLFLSTLSLRRATIPFRCAVHTGKFLSTLSLRRATTHAYDWPSSVINFYPRSPCGERPERFCNALEHLHFYPRSPCGERQNKKHCMQREIVFLSTLSLRRATRRPGLFFQYF